MMKRDIEFKFSRANGTPASKPSKAMTDALRQLSESAELKPLVTRARAKGRKVVVQVFESRDGYPFLIHLTAVDQKTA